MPSLRRVLRPRISALHAVSFPYYTLYSNRGVRQLLFRFRLGLVRVLFRPMPWMPNPGPAIQTENPGPTCQKYPPPLLTNHCSNGGDRQLLSVSGLVWSGCGREKVGVRASNSLTSRRSKSEAGSPLLPSAAPPFVSPRILQGLV